MLPMFRLLMPLALLAFKRGDVRLALQLLGCADRARTDEGLDLHSPERRLREAVMAGVRTVVPAAEVAALQVEGALWDGDTAFARGGMG